MNPRLSDRLSTLPETLSKAKTMEEVTSTIVDLERLVLRSNLEAGQNGNAAPYQTQNYEVGGHNSRGLSWKLNLLRAVSESNFCRMVRTGVHGGGVVLHGQPENIDVTLQIYTVLTGVYETVGQAAFTDFSDGQTEGAPKVHRAGWINQYLIESPSQLLTAVREARAKEAEGNSKISRMIGEREESLKAYQDSLAPAKPKAEPKPKKEKAPKSQKGSKANLSGEGEESTPETTSENGDGESTPDSDEYPEATAEG